MITPNNLLKHELTGLYVEVAKSKDPKKGGLCGKIVCETKNTITIETEKGEKIVPKAECTFLIKLEKTKVMVEGTSLVGRPEDRIKQN